MSDNKKQQVDFAQQTIRDLLGFIGIFCSVEIQDSKEDYWFVLKSEDSSILIGKGGQNLAAFNYIVHRIVEKKFPAGIRFLVDVNDYQKKRAEEIKDLARMHAQRVRYFKKDVELRPMNAYERRIVHVALEEYPDITTESAGSGYDRRVIIKPFNMVS